jgi:hypothetical protein
MKNKKLLAWFVAFAAIHCLLFWALPHLLPTFWDQYALFSINTLPWWPLHALGLPVSTDGLLKFPNSAGWIWCAFVWIGFYLSLAWAATRRTPTRDFK